MEIENKITRNNDFTQEQNLFSDSVCFLVLAAQGRLSASPGTYVMDTSFVLMLCPGSPESQLKTFLGDFLCNLVLSSCDMTFYQEERRKGILGSSNHPLYHLLTVSEEVVSN